MAGPLFGGQERRTIADLTADRPSPADRLASAVTEANLGGWTGAADLALLPHTLAGGVHSLLGLEGTLAQRQAAGFREALASRGHYAQQPPASAGQAVLRGAGEGLAPGAITSMLLRRLALTRGPQLSGALERLLLEPHQTAPVGAGASELIGSTAGGAAARAAAEVTDNPALQMLASIGVGVAAGTPAARLGGIGRGTRRAAADELGADLRLRGTADAGPGGRIPADPSAAPRRAGNINLDRMDSPEAVKQVIEETAERYGGDEAFMAARRGVQSWEETRVLADRLGQSVEETLLRRARGESWSAEYALAARNLLDESSTDVVAAAQRVSRGGTDADRAALQLALARQAAIQEQVSGVTAEAGRALNSFRILAKSRGQSDAIRAIIKAGGGDEVTDELAHYLAALDHPDEVAAVARRHARTRASTYADRAVELWLMGLLSGPQTHAVNITSNALFNAWHGLVEEPAAALVGAALRSPDRVRFREVAAQMYGSIEGLRTGMVAARRAFRAEQEGFALRMPGADTGQLEGRTPAISGTTGRIARLPGRALQAEDELFKGLAFTQKLYGLGMRDAIDQGLPMSQWQRHIQQYVQDPPQEALSSARDHAHTLTFTSDLGRSGRAVQSAINSNPAFKIVVPFFRTPVNLYKESIARNPVFAPFSPRLHRAFRAGGAERDRAIARLGAGGAVALWAVNAALEGRLTGSTPEDESERALFYAQGKAPYSVMTERDGKPVWLSLSRIEPWGSIIGISADAARAYQRGDISEGEWATEFAPMLVAAFAENLGNKTALQGASAFFEAYSSPDRYLDTYLEKMTGSLVPGAAAQMARAFDPYLRDQTGFANEVQARIPGLRGDLPARVDLLGRDERIGTERQSAGERLVSPFYTKEEKDLPVLQLMEAAGARVQPVDRFVQVPDSMLGAARGHLERPLRIELDPQMHTAYARQSGIDARERLEREMQTLATSSRDAARDRIEQIFSDVRKRRRDELLRGLAASGIIEQKARAQLERERIARGRAR